MMLPCKRRRGDVGNCNDRLRQVLVAVATAIASGAIASGAIAFGFVSAATSEARAAGGTMMVAQKGQPAHVAATLPEGVGAIINDPSRTSGWNSWFSEWPNDVNQYALEIESKDDLQRLIKKLGEVKADLVQIRLSHLKEPRGLGWVTKVDEGNGIPAVFSVGDQAVIDRWYQQVRKPFGVMEFTAVPVAVPPTLTLFVQNPMIDLELLESLPDHLQISAGYVPTVFHQSNTKLEQATSAAAKDDDRAQQRQQALAKLSQPERDAFDRIESFLAKRERAE